MYCLDTSSLLDASVRYYPIDIFPTLWSKLDIIVENGELIAPDEVLHELEKKDDEIYAWAKQRQKLFYPLNDQLQIVVKDEILATFPKLVDSKKNRSQADPFVVGLARITGRTVVTGERNAGNAQNPKIPDVCEFFGIRCINFLQFIREKGWNF